jgi:hypothetical protein
MLRGVRYVAVRDDAWSAAASFRPGGGIGEVVMAALLGHVLDHLTTAGVSVVEAKTLDRSSGYRPIEATRAFWERNGFVHIDTIDPLPTGRPATQRRFTWPRSAQPGDKHGEELTRECPGALAR